MLLSCILLQIENLANPETITITGLLVGYIWILREEVKAAKKEIVALTDHYRAEIKTLVEKNDVLQNEKYQITREIIPLLIELIAKLDKEKIINNGHE